MSSSYSLSGYQAWEQISHISLEQIAPQNQIVLQASKITFFATGGGFKSSVYFFDKPAP
jgi:hypothetical protein